MKRLLPLLLLAVSAPLFAQSAAPASGAEWGTPRNGGAAAALGVALAGCNKLRIRGRHGG